MGAGMVLGRQFDTIFIDASAAPVHDVKVETRHAAPHEGQNITRVLRHIRPSGNWPDT
jgi:hypothetical protein